MYLFVNVEFISKFYSFWPRNRNIHHCSIISALPRIYQLCHVDVLRERMKAGVWQFPLLPVLAIQKVMKHIFVQVRPNPLMRNSFLLRTHPHREEWKVLHHVSTMSDIASPWIHSETEQLGKQLFLADPLTNGLRCPLTVNPEGIWSLRTVFCTI